MGGDFNAAAIGVFTEKVDLDYLEIGRTYQVVLWFKRVFQHALSFCL
jgi:hypothetical protein